MHTYTILHLHLINGIGPGVILKLLSRGPKDLSELYAACVQDLINFGLSPAAAELVKKGLADKELLQIELDLIERYNVEIITILDPHYPPLLRHISCPPAVLYFKGKELHRFEKTIAIVGSRKGNAYAQDILAAWMPLFAQSGWSAISGGAIGVDTMAHKEALRNNMGTVAIIGSGLMQPYPSSNRRMFDAIMHEGGAVVSPFAMRISALPANFPARNRIISGMSQACLVVQAAKKSGASITAEYALEQGRSVFTVPGSVFDPLHEGCHALIHEGATLAASAQQILSELGEVVLADKEPVQVQSSIMPVKKTLPDNASLAERIVYYCAEQPCSLDELMSLVNHDGEPDLIYEQLFNLQLVGKIEQNASGLWFIS